MGLDDLTEGSTHRSHHRRGRGCLPALVALVLIAALALFAYVKGVDLIKGVLSGPEDYSGQGHGSVVVQVKEGNTSAAIASTLVASSVVRSAAAFIDAAEADDRSRGIQPGCYEMRQKMSAKNALALMLAASSHVDCPGEIQLTIPEGLRAAEILGRIAHKTHIDRTELEQTLKSPDSLDLPDYADGDPEGYLFPATYDVTVQTSSTALLAAMVHKFSAEADSLGLPARADELGVSPHDVVVVASLVQAEASRPQDMPKVASVIYNRLDAHMPLQLDSTLHYAVASRGVVQTSPNLRSLKSPYNTYRHAGLPPTAIDSPGAKALQAALRPADTGYRYFVTVNLRTGDTRFARSFASHKHNVQLLHEYCKSSDAC
jgi:peptidoglycan lytic transglycosylase G